MPDKVTIASRFNGPPRSANGGYTCGITAAGIPGPARVRLHVPPPIDEPLQRDVTDHTTTLHTAGGDPVADAVRAEPELDVGAPVTLAEAGNAAAAFDTDAFAEQHYFPTCFTCGPHRTAGDGLRVFPARLDGSAAAVAWPWTPDRSVPYDDSGVDAAIMWAVLDCPSGWAWYHEGPAEPHVLGQLTAHIHRRAQLDEPTVVAAWPNGTDGRKGYSTSAIWSSDGELLAAAQATWVTLTPQQFAQFRVATAARS